MIILEFLCPTAKEVNLTKMEQCLQKTRRVYHDERRYYRPLQPTRQQRLKRIRQRLYEKDNRCFYCRSWISDFKDATLDHLHPLAKGGTDSAHNLVLACIPCNRAKGSFATVHEARDYAQAKKAKRAHLSRGPRRSGVVHHSHNRVPTKDQSADGELQRAVVSGDLPHMSGKEARLTASEIALLGGIVWYQHTVEELKAMAKRA